MTRTSSTQMNNKKVTMTQMELKKLKSLLPTLKQKPSSSPIEIVMETIRYIRALEDQLIDRFHMDTSGKRNLSLFFFILTVFLFSSIIIRYIN
jgi:hypothetical protein